MTKLTTFWGVLSLLSGVALAQSLGTSGNYGIVEPPAVGGGTGADYNDDVKIRFGTGNDVTCQYQTDDANAKVFVCTLDESDDSGNNIPAFVWGEETNVLDTDLALLDAIVEGAFVVINNAGDAYLALDAGDVNGTENGIYFVAAADEDITILKASVTGTPTLIWDESGDAFTLNDGIGLAVGTDSDFRIEFDGTDTVITAGSTPTSDIMLAHDISPPAPDTGTLHYWRGTAGTVDCIDTGICIEDNADAGLTLMTPNNKTGQLWFGSPDSQINAGIIYGHSAAGTADTMRFRVDANYVIHLTGSSLDYQQAQTVSTLSGAYTLTPDLALILNTDDSAGAPNSAGDTLEVQAQTFTDSSTAESGTATIQVFNSFATPTLAATNASVTTTDTANVYIAGAPAAGTNQTLTNSWALLVDAGNVRIDEGLIITNGLAFGGTTLGSDDCGRVVMVTAGVDGNTINLPTTILGCKITLMYTGADGGALVDVSPNDAVADGIHGSCTLAGSVVEFSGTDDADIGLTKATANTGDTISLIGDGSVGWFVLTCTGIWANN
jgi:hypothetical protein